MFAVLYEHDIEPNENMSCPFRSGKGKVEYSPAIIAQLSDEQIELCLKAEAIRILLKHPYERQPVGCRRKSMSYGSNLVLADNYNFYDIGYKHPSAYNLPSNESYEYYSIQVENMDSYPEDNDDDDEDTNNGNVSKGSSADDTDDAPSNGNSNGTGTNSKSETSPSENKNNNANNSPADTQPRTDSSADDSQSDDSYVLTLADGTTLRIPKGNATGGGIGGSTGGGTQNTGGGAQSNASGSAQQQSSGGNAQSSGGSSNSPMKKHRTNFSKGFADLSQLWEEDDFMGCTIDSIIEDTDSWGNIPGDVVAQIMANVKVKVDYRKVLSGFRASVLSSKRQLTRLRPNRRSGFENMGSVRKFDTKLLVAVDVSGTISDASIARFYSAINRMFKYGMEHIDTVQFDYEMGEVRSFKRKVKKVTVVGRGGTSYQPIFDYIAEHTDYDGLIIFTDGYAEKPVLSKKVRTKIAWVCNNRRNYETNGEWMRQFGRCCAMEF